MALITAADLTFNGEEIKSVSEAVFESGFAKPALEELHTVVTGIVAKKQIAILGRMSGLIGKGTGACNPTADANTFPMSEKFWNPAVSSGRLSECWTSLQETFFIWGLKMGVQKADLTGTDFLNYISEMLVDAIYEAVLRIAWFNDIAAANTNATPAGVITAGIDLGYFNKIDGLWKQVFAVVSADASRKTAGLATKNAGASYALQAFNDTDTTNRVVTKMLQNIRMNADTRLRAKTDSIIVVTQSVADQYERELTATQSVFSIEYLENGIQILKSGGVTIYAFEFWDRMIAAYFDNGTTTYLPHRALFYSKPNVQIGTEDVATLSELDIFYDKKTKENIIDFAFNVDAKLTEGYLVQAAY